MASIDTGIQADEQGGRLLFGVRLNFNDSESRVLPISQIRDVFIRKDKLVFVLNKTRNDRVSISYTSLGGKESAITQLEAAFNLLLNDTNNQSDVDTLYAEMQSRIAEIEALRAKVAWTQVYEVDSSKRVFTVTLDANKTVHSAILQVDASLVEVSLLNTLDLSLFSRDDIVIRYLDASDNAVQTPSNARKVEVRATGSLTGDLPENTILILQGTQIINFQSP